MDPIEDAVPELPPDMWQEIVNFLQEEETLLTMTQVSKGAQDTAENELTRRWVEKGFLLATGPKELARALADPDAQVIITRGGTVDVLPANPHARVIVAGPVAVAIGPVYVRDAIGTITSVTGDGYVVASGAAQVSNVSRGTVYARDSVQVSNVSGGTVRPSGSAQVAGVTGDGYVVASGAAQVTDITGGHVYAYDNARVSATGGVIRAYGNASVHSEGATVHVYSRDAMITATGGEIHSHVLSEHIVYSGDVTFYNDHGRKVNAPTAFGE